MEENQHEIEPEIFPFLAVILDNCFKLQFKIPPPTKFGFVSQKLIFQGMMHGWIQRKLKKMPGERCVK
jgi:hypothetical protein